MPPKSKFTKEQITKAALEIVQEAGSERLTARTLAKKLKCSSCPIFTVFENMDEVFDEVIAAAKTLYKKYIEKGLESIPAFKGVGTQYILFSIQEPKLFQLLFMSEQANEPSIVGVLPIIDESYEKILASIIDEYNLDIDNAKKIYRHLWVYSHGIATLCATKMCHFTGEDISEMLTSIFVSLLKNIREEYIDD